MPEAKTLGLQHVLPAGHVVYVVSSSRLLCLRTVMGMLHRAHMPPHYLVLSRAVALRLPL